jgi:tRNA(Ile2) C34 agmatinyltransferase TiaS
VDAEGARWRVQGVDIEGRKVLLRMVSDQPRCARCEGGTLVIGGATYFCPNCAEQLLADALGDDAVEAMIDREFLRQTKREATFMRKNQEKATNT